jgi:hypothetical protein
MVTPTSTSPNTKLDRRLDAFAQYLCACRGLAECTIADYLKRGVWRWSAPTCCRAARLQQPDEYLLSNSPD